jgi:hypothetical protein
VYNVHDFTKEFRFTFQKIKATKKGLYNLYVYHKFSEDDLNLEANLELRARKDHIAHRFSFIVKSFLKKCDGL